MRRRLAGRAPATHRGHHVRRRSGQRHGHRGAAGRRRMARRHRPSDLRAHDAGAGRRVREGCRAASTASSDVSLSVRAGEILGIAGVDGNGQRALAEVIAGQRRVARRGDPARGHRGDRAGGLRPPAARACATSPTTGSARVSWGATRWASTWCSSASAMRRTGAAAPSTVPPSTPRRDELIGEFDIRTPSPETNIGKLSGGNIQKALLARELSFEPRVVVFNKPTHGLDVRTIAMVRERIRTLAAPRRGDHRHLHRPGRAGGPLRPGRRAVRGPDRRHRDQRAGCGDSHR